jgi:hypothetical protein
MALKPQKVNSTFCLLIFRKSFCVILNWLKKYSNRLWQKNLKIKTVPKTTAFKVYVVFTVPGVDVMITIFCDLCQLSAKKWHFSQKQM